ncbi:hypothetical protein DRO03_04100 [Methanosarcinales archaeon]|nr:MAG: hypothetical protein DRO03_04100 [Methanosarcinales archaeon]
METKTLGRYIVGDPDIHHGEPTFRGTCIMVADVLQQVESDMALEAIIEGYKALTRDAIAEVVRMVGRRWVNYAAQISSGDKNLMNSHKRTPHT